MHLTREQYTKPALSSANHALAHNQCRLLVRRMVLPCRTEGMRGFYRGWAANTIKVVPQNSIRFVTYEMLKGLLGIKKSKTDT